MATRKTDVRKFRDWLGQDVTSDALERDKSSALSAKNLERLANNSLRGRQGCKISAPPLYTEKLHKYSYIDTDGNPQQELLCIGAQSLDVASSLSRAKLNGSLFRLKENALTINYSGSNAWALNIRFGVDKIEAVLIENGVELFTKDLGTGYEESYVLLKALADDINAETNFTCFPDKTAVINGTQGTVSNITVDSGHTFEAGDWIPFWPDGIASAFGGSQEWYECTNTGLTSVRIPFTSEQSCLDNQVLGHGVFPAAILDLNTDAESISASKTYSYSHWEPVKCLLTEDPNYTDTPFSAIASKFGGINLQQPTFVNKRNCCYISANYATISNNAKIVNDNPIIFFEAGVWKYDGYNMYLSGPICLEGTDALGVIFPDTTLAPISDGSGTALATGEYKYQFSFVKRDGRDNELESFFELQATLNHTGPKNANVQIKIDSAGARDPFNRRFYDLRRAACTATEGTATTVFSVSNGHTLRAGDYVYFIDTFSVTQGARVASHTYNTITLENEHTITSGNYIANVAVRVWRTKESGNEFLLAKTVPFDTSGSGNQSIIDDTADDDLGIKLNSVKEVTLQYSMPRVNCLANHQGALVGGGGVKFSQSILWEDPIYPESVDYARNVNEVPESESGSINYLVSRENSSLVIAKSSSVFEAVGSFSASEVEITKLDENLYGTQSTSGMAALADILAGCGKTSMWVIAGDAIDPSPGYPILTPILEGNTNFCKARIVYDSAKKWLHIFLPEESLGVSANHASTDHYYATDSSKYYVIQLGRQSGQSSFWAEFTYDEKQLPSGGMCLFNDTFYTNSAIYDSDNSRWTGFLHKRLQKEAYIEAEDYSDNGSSYEWDMIPQWDDADEPEYDKTWHEFVMYALQPEFFIADFTALFESYRNWDLSKVDTERLTNLSFTSTDLEKGLQFDKKYRAKRRTFKISGTVFKNPPVFSGYAYTVDDVVFRHDKFGRST